MENSMIKTIESTPSIGKTTNNEEFVKVDPFFDGDLVTDDKDMQVICC